ncbi:unnamed protein product [Calicophoron daubneyi]|uniref:RNA helicase n=1 Tax=Calicophoron daubneyi TaxID=300641 RepID=A0AAV2TVT1_CALDB
MARYRPNTHVPGEIRAPRVTPIDRAMIARDRRNLPIFKHKEDLLAAFNQNQTLIVIGETGSGKSTQLTQYLAEAGYASTGRIGCTQPRRVAAKSVATRVAQEYGCGLGQEVGFSIRFEDCTGSGTIIKYMTDGKLLGECLEDPNLQQYSVIILDEAHERALDTDVLFGLLRNAVERRDDLKVIVTSATLESGKFSDYFFHAPTFYIKGRTFPVDIIYTPTFHDSYVESVLEKVVEIHSSEPSGDILAFLTGQDEIEECCELVQQIASAHGCDSSRLVPLPAYSGMRFEDLNTIFKPVPSGCRKVVFATNVAESSLTIDGIRYVVDSGYVKQKQYDTRRQMNQMKDQADQRSGRAGRTRAGKCYRMYDEYTYSHEMDQTTTPEIQRANLANVVLILKAMGINDVASFKFLDQPPLQALTAAEERLRELDALDSSGALTSLGRKMSEIPLEPELSKLLIKSVELGCSDEMLTIVSMPSIKNVFIRPKKKRELADVAKSELADPEGDHLTLLNVYKEWEANDWSDDWCYEHFLRSTLLNEAFNIRKQLLGMMNRLQLGVFSCGADTSLVRQAILSAFYSNVAHKQSRGHSYTTVGDGRVVWIHPSSVIFNKNPEWLVFQEVNVTGKAYMEKVTTIDSAWLDVTE